MSTKILRLAQKARALPDLSGRLALRVAEVARLIGVSPATVRGMVARGELPGRRIGAGKESASYVIPTAGLVAWLAGDSPAGPHEGVGR